MYKRQLEKANMKRVVEIMDQKRNEKKELERIKAEGMRRAEEADRKEEEERKKKSWKFW